MDRFQKKSSLNDVLIVSKKRPLTGVITLRKLMR